MTHKDQLHQTTVERHAAALDKALRPLDELIRLRAVEEHAGLMRDAVESLSVGHAQRAETVRGALRLIVRAYDEGVASQ